MKNLKFTLSAIMLMVSAVMFAQPEGHYYLYNSASRQFLSRDATGANADQFGIPVEIKKGSNGYSLMYLDNGRYLSQSGTTVKGDQTTATYATIESTEGGYLVAFDNQLGIETNGNVLTCKDAPQSSSFNSKWQLLTQTERDAIVAADEAAQIEAIAKAAGINLPAGTDKQALLLEALKAYNVEDATERVSNPALSTSQDSWTVKILAGNQNIAYKSQYPMTLYQNTAMEISQTIEVPNGIYKATIQNTYRSSKREHLTTLSENEGISICNAYFAANDNKAQAVEWSKIRTSSTLPYSRGDFDNFGANPKYTTTVWAFVNNGKLTLKYAVPAINNTQGDYDLNWFTFANVTLTRYYSATQVDLSQFDIYNDIADQAADATSYYAVIDSMKQAVVSQTASAEDIKNMPAEMRKAIFNLMKTQPAKSGQYDVTSFITNPSFDNGIKGWTTANGKITSTGGIAELYNQTTTDRIYQKLKDMPAGDYTLKVQAFYRAGEMKQSLANYERGKDIIKSFMYIGLKDSKAVQSIFDDGCYMLQAQTSKSADVYAIISGRGFPHSHYIGSDRSNPIKTPLIASQAFDHGHYWNTLNAHIDADGDLTLGIRLSAGGSAQNWLAIDNFRLYYGTPAPVTLTEGQPLPVNDDITTDVVLKKHFKAGEMTPLAVPCDIPASQFKAVYEIGSLDEQTQTALLYPVNKVRANVPCYVVAETDIDYITIDSTYVTAAKADMVPVLWEGGLIYPAEGTYTWRTLTVADKEYDASHFTNFEFTDPQQMSFTVNIENFRARQYLENTSYPEPETPSVIGDYFKPAPPRLDIPHNIGIPLPGGKLEANATVLFSLSADMSDAQSRTIYKGSDFCYIPNLIPGNTYYYRVEAGEEVLTKGHFKVEGPVRMIYAPSISNIRDLGGWTVQDGQTVRYGLIYRGGEANGLHPSVAADRTTLINLGIGAEIDLRKDNNYDSGNGEVGKCAFGFASSHYFFREGGYDCKLEHLTNAASKKRYKEWFAFILDHIRQGKAVYYHCVWGADRTGLVSVLLEGLLGLSQEQMNKEYELTSLSFAGLRPKSGYADGDHQKLIEKIKTYDGATLRDKFDTYWTKEVGVSIDDIQEFRSLMLFDPNASSPTDVNLDGMTDTQDVLNVYEFIQRDEAVNDSTIQDVNRDGSVDTQDVLTIYNDMQ